MPHKVSQLPSRTNLLNSLPRDESTSGREGSIGAAHSQVGLRVLFFQTENFLNGLSRAHRALPQCGRYFQFPSNGRIPSPGLILHLDMPQLLLPSPLLDSAPPQFLPSPCSPDSKHPPAPAPAPADALLTSWASVPASSNCLPPPCRWFQGWLLFKRAASGSHVN